MQSAAAALSIAKVDSTVHERRTRRMLNFRLRFCSCTAYYAWQMCMCECAQIMLIIVTQLAAEGSKEGGGGRGASQLNPNGCILQQRRPQTIPVQCRNSSCRRRRRQLCNFLISLTLCLSLPFTFVPSSLSFLFLWRCMKVISCMRN